MSKRKKVDAAAIAAVHDKVAALLATASVEYHEEVDAEPIASAEDAGLRLYKAGDAYDAIVRRVIQDVPSLAVAGLKSTDPAALKFRAGALRAYMTNLGPQWIVRSDKGRYAVVASAERPKDGTAELIDLPALCTMSKTDWAALKKAAPQRHAALLPVSDAANDATRGRFKTFMRQVAQVKSGGKVKRAGRPKGSKTNDTFTRLAAAIKGLLNLAKAGEGDGSLTKDQAGTLRLAAKSIADIKPVTKPAA